MALAFKLLSAKPSTQNKGDRDDLTVQKNTIFPRVYMMSQTAIAGKRVFICGSALRGQPDNSNLGDAKFIREAKTRPIYRLHSAENGWHPAIYEVAASGVSIPGEVYELTLEQFEQLAAGEPPHMYPSDVVLDDGEVLTAFLYPQELVEKYQWLDISDRGGWAAYKGGS